MQSQKELVDAIERINQCTNFLAQEVIDVRDHGAQSQAISDRLTRVAKVLERIGNDPNDPAPKDLPTE